MGRDVALSALILMVALVALVRAQASHRDPMSAVEGGLSLLLVLLWIIGLFARWSELTEFVLIGTAAVLTASYSGWKRFGRRAG